MKKVLVFLLAVGILVGIFAVAVEIAKEISSVLVIFATGLLFGEVLDFIYDLYVNKKEDKVLEVLPWFQTIFHWFEHYHWGIFLLLFRHPFLNGIGFSFILDENRSRRSGEWGFGYRDPENRDKYYHFKQSTAIGILMFLTLFVRWIFPFEVLIVYVSTWILCLIFYADYWAKSIS